MKKTQLKSVIKSIVRECINERCGGSLAGGAKGGRMFKHIKQGYKGEKSPEDAERIAAATVNKNLGEGGGDLHPRELIGKTCDHCGKGQYGPRYGKAYCSVCGHMPMQQGGLEEAGMTSENGGGYDEKEEIMLIKVMALIAKKLEAMHAGEEGSEEPVGMEVGPEEPDGGEPMGDEPVEEPDGGEPIGGDEPIEDPTEEPTAEEPEGENPFPKKEKDDELDEAAYKVVAPRSATDAKEDKARRIQTEPKVNERKGRMKESAYKVQGPSLKTFKDSPQFPKAVANPKNA